ncbi:NeuD/PglB/VioB family sugar acetyltransferase [Oscillospiraceae bacterium CM]|nr:NeuD/PglB/VioB family sugar acetyltransferase [Oscillospiraceae bacterium CM]
MENLIIYGAGDLGREFLWLAASSLPGLCLLGFLDDALLPGTVIWHYPVLGDATYFERILTPTAVLCAVGAPTDKRRIVRALKRLPFICFPAVVHPSAILADRTKLGEGSVVGPLCTVSVDTIVGSHVLINQGCAVGHHGYIGDFAMLAPGCRLGGHVTVGEGAVLGVGCSIKPGVAIGEYAVIGAGAAVVCDIPAYCTAVGVPARPCENSVGISDV